MESVEKLSRISLVACDQSYWGGPLSNNPDQDGPIKTGVVLGPHPDSGVDADVFPNIMPATFFNPISTGLSEWVVFDRHDDPQSGFGATIYRRINTVGTADFMVAFQGTRGPSTQDWNGNLEFGVDKWISPAGGGALISQLSSLLTSGAITGDIYFTGQSLGGALAEYAAYDFRKEADRLADSELISPFSNHRLALITYDGLGGIAGLQKVTDDRKQVFDVNALSGSTTRHYWIAGDIVHRLGEGTGALQGQVHLNGHLNAYRLDFFAEPEMGLPDAIDGQPRWKKAIDAHRVETGFYAGINYADADFRFSANQQDVIPWHISELGNFATVFGNLYNSYDSARDGEATARIVATLIYGIAFGDKEQIQEVVNVVTESTYRSGIISKKQYDIVRKGAPAMLAELANSSAGVNLQMRALILATILDSFEQSETITPETLETATKGSELYNDVARFPPNTTLDAIRVLALTTFDKTLGKREDWTRTSLEVARKIVADSVADPTLYSDVRRVTREHLDELIGLLFEEDGLKAFGTKVVYYSLAARLDEAVAMGQALGYVKSLVESAGKVGDVPPAIPAEFAADAMHLSAELGSALATAIPEFTGNPGDSSIVLDDFQTAVQQRSAVSAFLDGLQSLADIVVSLSQGSGGDAGAAIEDIKALVSTAGQSVVITSGQEVNPFEQDTFDPESSPISAGTLTEGSLATWTLYLPYEAGTDGQRIELELAGTDANKLSILADGEAIDLAADGTFTLTVAEGSREATFQIAALADLDADEAFTLSATLVNASGEATHLEHEEAQIALRAEAEAAPVTTVEVHGDWAPKEFTDPLTGKTVYHHDAFGNVERLPGVPISAPIEGSDGTLYGSDGAETVVTGDFYEQVFAYAGDDAIQGSDLHGSVFYAGAGNDWIEAGRYDNHAADFVQLDFLGRPMWLGEDKIYGGAGNDRIYGDREADLASLYDPNTTPSGLPGDWSSGGSGEDEVFGGAGDDVLMGGAGEDLLVGGAGMDVLFGDDHFLLRPEGNFWAVLHPNFGDASPQFGGFEVGLFPVVNATLSFPDGVFPQTGDPDYTYYKDGGGADVLIGGAGQDILIGQIGADVLYGGEDDDILAGWEGADQLIGGVGDDLMAGDFGRDEQVNQRTVDGQLIVRPGVMGSAAAHGSPVHQAGNDFLDGGAGNDRMWGEGGADEILGGEGDDVLFGDAPYLPEELHGADRLDGGLGDDELHGGGADDRLFGGTGNDMLNGDRGNDRVDGGAGEDELFGGDGDDVLQGAAGADVLAGDAGADALHGGEGDDQLDGGEGHDSLYGGSGDDVLEAGDGDDLLDAGIGNDVVHGGAGNDTYAFSLGYGHDVIEDSEGANRLRFGNGITAAGLEATLDAETLTARIGYGFVGDSVSLAMDASHPGAVEFADGTVWSEKQLLALVPALRAEGSEDDDSLEAVPFLRNDLRGLEGNDLLNGGANDDRLEGGAGDDVLDGLGGSDTYAYGATEDGIDALADSDAATQAYLDRYYADLGVPDWMESAQYAGQYRALGFGDGGPFYAYFATYEEAQQSYPDSEITHVEPLAEPPPLVRRDDAASLDELRSAGVLSWDLVEFGPGMSLEDLALVFRVNEEDARAEGEAAWHAAGTLSVRWNGGASGFDVAVPDVNYGFVGPDLVHDGGYRLGDGVEAFRFADGSELSLEGLLSRASFVELASPYHFFRGSGEQQIGRNVRSVVFEDDIGSSEVAASRDGTDVLLTLGDGSRGRIAGWYADPANMPVTRLEFAFDEPIEAAALTDAGLIVSGSDEAELVQGLDDFADVLYGLGGDDTLTGGSGADFLGGFAGQDVLAGGAGDDTLDGGAERDVYVLERGTGHDRIQSLFGAGPLSDDVLRAVPDLGADDLLFSRDWNGFSIWVRGTEDRIELDRWFSDPQWRVAGIELGDGTFLGADDMEARLEAAPGTAADDVVLGTERDELLEGLAGEDIILGGAGDDVLRGGAGDDDLEDWEGHNVLEGGAGGDSLYHEGQSFLAGGAGDDFIESGGADSVIAFNAGDGHDTLYATDRFTLSLGFGIAPQDLTLAQDGDDLVLSVGAADSVRFSRQFEDDPTAWPEITLQMFGSVHLYAFNAVIDALYSAEDPTQPLQLGTLLPQHELAASETDALGGALAWQYGAVRSLGGLGASQIAAALADPAFGQALQPIAADAANRAPVLASPIADQTAGEDAPFAFTVAADAFVDPDAESLSLSATLIDGKALPAWLEFDAATGRFAGTPRNEDVALLGIRVTASDAQGESASDVFELTVLNTNDAPIVANALAHQAAVEGLPFTFALPADTFTDSDPDDRLLYSATLSNGSLLPAWLAFDPANATFGGTPGLADGGDYSFLVSATDVAGASVSTFLGVTVTDSLAVDDRLIGTAADDALNGTASAEYLDGKRGADHLAGGGGNDTLQFSADGEWKGAWRARNVGSPGSSGTDDSEAVAGKRRSLDFFDGGAGFDSLLGTDSADAIFLDDGSARLASIELIDTGDGRDLVDLTSRRFAYSGVVVDGGTGDDVLWTSSGDDVLLGGRGDDKLAGGAGNDVYVYAPGDGRDTIRDTGGDDTLLFDEGIQPSTLRFDRHHDDLVVRAGRGSSGVTIADWFASRNDQIERIQFADGSAWDLTAIAGRLKHGAHGASAPSDRTPFAGRNGHRSFEARPSGERDDRHDEPRGAFDAVAQAISRRLAETFSLGPAPESRVESLDDIAAQWAAVQRFARRLAYETDDGLQHAMAPAWRVSGIPVGPDATGFGFEASLGMLPAPKGFESFAGLDEGFKRL